MKTLLAMLSLLVVNTVATFLVGRHLSRKIARAYEKSSGWAWDGKRQN
jgi:hypothetical protein